MLALPDRPPPEIHKAQWKLDRNDAMIRKKFKETPSNWRWRGEGVNDFNNVTVPKQDTRGKTVISVKEGRKAFRLLLSDDVDVSTLAHEVAHIWFALFWPHGSAGNEFWSKKKEILWRNRMAMTKRLTQEKR